MEKHRCKLCSKSFSNGRALGGHMKSHLLASPPTRKRLTESHHESSASSSSSSFDPLGKSPSYRLRENPRKSFRAADADPGSSFVVLFDARDDPADSQTESEPGNPVPKRVRKPGGENRRQRSKKTTPKKKAGRKSKVATADSPEPASSVSDASPEEDLAMCLIMLSRDTRKRELKLISDNPDKAEEEMKPIKTHCSELRRCLIDLNLPPAADDDEACSVVSAA